MCLLNYLHSQGTLKETIFTQVKMTIWSLILHTAVSGCSFAGVSAHKTPFAFLDIPDDATLTPLPFY